MKASSNVFTYLLGTQEPFIPLHVYNLHLRVFNNLRQKHVFFQTYSTLEKKYFQMKAIQNNCCLEHVQTQANM
jgi:hypothetical protein